MGLFSVLRLCVTAFEYVGKKKLNQLARLRELDELVCLPVGSFRSGADVSQQAWRALRRGSDSSLLRAGSKLALNNRRNSEKESVASAPVTCADAWEALALALHDAASVPKGGNVATK